AGRGTRESAASPGERKVKVRKGRMRLAPARAIWGGGCAAPRRQEARANGDLLVAAGFKTKLADSPERAQKLRAMPPLKLLSQSKDGQTVYRYADPYSCDCLYVGDQQAYTKYRSLALQKQRADEQLEVEEDTTMEWDLWGPRWGAGPPVSGQRSELLHEGLAGGLPSTGGGLGRRRRQLCAVLGARHRGRAVPLRRPRREAGDGADQARGTRRPGVALLPAGGPPGIALRLPRVRAVRSGCRPSLQPAQAPARSLRQGHRADGALGRLAVRLSRGRREGRSRARRSRQRAVHAQEHRDRSGILLGRRPAAVPTPARDRDLRGSREGLHNAASRRAGSPSC